MSSYHSTLDAFQRRRGFASLVAPWAIALQLVATAVCSVSAEPSEYERAVEEALEQYERGRWDEAAALFRRAHQLNPSARTLRGLGLSVYEARHYPDAIRYLSEALEETRRPLTEKQREEASATIARAKLFVGNLKLKLEPPDARVAINGQRLEPNEQGVIVTEPGSLDVEIRAEGYQPLVRRVRVNAGESSELSVKLSPAGDAAPAASTFAQEGSARAAGKTAAPSVAREAPPPSLATDDKRAPSDESAAHDGEHPLQTWKWVSAGGAVAALAAASAMLIVQKTQAPAYDTECVKAAVPKGDCGDRNQLLGSTLWTGSIVGFSVGAGLAALSVALFVLDADEAHEKAPGLACAPGPGAFACRYTF